MSTVITLGFSAGTMGSRIPSFGFGAPVFPPVVTLPIPDPLRARVDAGDEIPDPLKARESLAANIPDPGRARWGLYT